MSDARGFASGLRALADWYEAHPDQPLPLAELDVFVNDVRELATAALALGNARKRAGGNWFWIRREFGGGVVLDFNILRAAVCTRRVTGTIVVPASPEHTEEILEWDCGTVMGALLEPTDLGLVAVPESVEREDPRTPTIELQQSRLER